MPHAHRHGADRGRCGRRPAAGLSGGGPPPMSAPQSTTRLSGKRVAMKKKMGSNRLQPRLRKAAIAMASSAAILAFTAAAAQSPVDLANPLVGTAPLDAPAVIGNRSEEHTSELQSQ